jgi:hypothetical protein
LIWERRETPLFLLRCLTWERKWTSRSSKNLFRRWRRNKTLKNSRKRPKKLGSQLGSSASLITFLNLSYGLPEYWCSCSVICITHMQV